MQYLGLVEKIKNAQEQPMTIYNKFLMPRNGLQGQIAYKQPKSLNSAEFGVGEENQSCLGEFYD